MKQLRQAIVSLEAATFERNPLAALRQWRTSAAKAYVRRASGELPSARALAKKLAK